MKPTAAILLAGGRGTRLGALTDSTPKPLLEVAGRPFVFFVLDYLKASGIERIFISTGYLADQFEQKIGNSYGCTRIEYLVETEPLGTGGAIMSSLRALGETAFVLNADTLFRINLSQMAEMHKSLGADVTIAVRQVSNLSRYGAVLVQGARVISFGGEQNHGPGLINGGIYLLSPRIFSGVSSGAKFSFEREFLPGALPNLCVAAYEDSGYFIDMGVPMDFARAQIELQDN